MVCALLLLLFCLMLGLHSCVSFGLFVALIAVGHLGFFYPFSYLPTFGCLVCSIVGSQPWSSWVIAFPKDLLTTLIYNSISCCFLPFLLFLAVIPSMFVFENVFSFIVNSSIGLVNR